MLTDPFGTNSLTKAIIGCAIRVHRTIGPGVYESVYAECMEYELKDKGLPYEPNDPLLSSTVATRSNRGSTSTWWSRISS
jgi:PD-(D/E)XK nuclease superfamily